MEFLSTNFVMDYVEANPKPLNELGEFVYTRTYSRWLEHRGRREYWHETIKRAVEFSMAQEYRHVRDMGFKPDLKKLRDEAQTLFKNIYDLKQAPSGRSLWIANANEAVNENFILGQFNCSFIQIEQWEDLEDVFYALMVGSGVGIRATKKTARKMPKIRTEFSLTHEPYDYIDSEDRLQGESYLEVTDNEANLTIADSKEGWTTSLRLFFDILTKEDYKDVNSIHINYNNVRPKGERLKTFGGTASGYKPLKEMYDGIQATLQGTIDKTLEPIILDEKGFGEVRPVHILDIANLIGNNVVVGKQ